MSTQDYVAGRYITIDEGFQHLGYTTVQKNTMAEVDRSRYINWIKEANNNVETDLFPASDVIPLDPASQVFSYAKSAALNWLMYKKRDLAGSRNASAAKSDYDRDIERARNFLAKTPTQKMYPIGVDRTDVLDTYIIPYSENQGWPPDFLY